VLRQQRKSDVMTSFVHSTRSAIYYQARSPLNADFILLSYTQVRWIRAQKSQLLFKKIKISAHFPIKHILANMTNSHGINKMTYIAKSAFILTK
jgi:hypothetical protein